MKKILIPILCIIMSITCFAQSESSVVEYYYEDGNITVSFDTNSNYTTEEQKIIADRLVFGYDSNESSSTYAWCWLTGHNLTTETVATIEHKVLVSDPRCFKTFYEVVTCSKCDYYEQTEIASTYLSCCPED